MIEVSTTCPSCAHHLEVSRCEHRSGWMALCPNCYGPVEDSSFLEMLQGYGATPEAALWDWMEQYEEEVDLTFVIGNSLLNELQRQVERETAAQKDCRFCWNGLRFLPGTTAHEVEAQISKAGGDAREPIIFSQLSEKEQEVAA